MYCYFYFLCLHFPNNISNMFFANSFLVKINTIKYPNMLIKIVRTVFVQRFSVTIATHFPINITPITGPVKSFLHAISFIFLSTLLIAIQSDINSETAVVAAAAVIPYFGTNKRFSIIFAIAEITHAIRHVFSSIAGSSSTFPIRPPISEIANAMESICREPVTPRYTLPAIIYNITPHNILITTKNAALEDKQKVKNRIAEASQYVPLERLCLSPQCGFASTEEGNKLTEKQQWNKIRLMLKIAHSVWKNK